MENFELTPPDNKTIFCNIELLHKTVLLLKEIYLNEDNEALNYVKDYIKNNYLNPDELEIIEPIIKALNQDAYLKDYLIEHFEKCPFTFEELNDGAKEVLFNSYVNNSLEWEFNDLYNAYTESPKEYIESSNFDDALCTHVYDVMNIQDHIKLTDIYDDHATIEYLSSLSLKEDTFLKIYKHIDFQYRLERDLTKREIKHFKLAWDKDYYFIDAIDELDTCQKTYERSDFAVNKLIKYYYKINNILQGIFEDTKQEIEKELKHKWSRDSEALRSFEHFENQEINMENEYNYQGTML